jgi:hypothetical protein
MTFRRSVEAAETIIILDDTLISVRAMIVYDRGPRV